MYVDGPPFLLYIVCASESTRNNVTKVFGHGNKRRHRPVLISRHLVRFMARLGSALDLL